MRRPLLMMRTRGLLGPAFGRHVGNRASHPLAHSQGNVFREPLAGATTVPDILTLTEANAVIALTTAELTGKRQGIPTTGTVATQGPKAGTVVLKGSLVEYTLTG